MGLLVDMSGLPPGVVEEFRKGRHAREVKTLMAAPEQQLRVANEMNQTHASIDGLGRLRMAITSEAFHYWGRRLGYECWKDKQFLREFERDNPSVRVKSTGTRIQSGYRGGLVAASKYAPVR
jgi:hypothetical protein